MGTQSRSEAKIRVLGVVQGWKQQIAIARDPQGLKTVSLAQASGSLNPNPWRQELARSRDDPFIEEALFNIAADNGDEAFLSFQVAIGEEVLLSEHLESYLDGVLA